MMTIILSSFILISLFASVYCFRTSKYAMIKSKSILHMAPPQPGQPSQPDEPSAPPRRESPINIPTVGSGAGQLDVMSKLVQDRILMLGSEVNDEVANSMISSMLYLASEDPEADITLYINSPGGSVQAGLAIFDTMKYIPNDVSTVCFGMAASMGAFLLSAGTKGKRKSLPNSRIMIHQPLGGSQGDATDMEIMAKLILHTKETLNTYLSEFCTQPIDKIRTDTDRDFYMTPEESLSYGIIDEVIQHKNMLKERPKVPKLKVPPPLSIYDVGLVSKGGSSSLSSGGPPKKFM
jgi:ATP-dependent Clp endopeptidase proteolytic subunit ClpP